MSISREMKVMDARKFREGRNLREDCRQGFAGNRNRSELDFFNVLAGEKSRRFEINGLTV